MIQSYSTITNSLNSNQALLMCMDYADWQALSFYPCLRGSRISVLDYQAVGNHVVFVKNSNTDHNTTTGFVLDTIATATPTTAGKVLLYGSVTTATNGAVTPGAVKTYVDTALADLVNASPSTLDTLNELAAALGNDANFATTITNTLATKWTIGGNATTALANFGSTANFGVNMVVNSVPVLKLMPVPVGATSWLEVNAGVSVPSIMASGGNMLLGTTLNTASLRLSAGGIELATGGTKIVVAGNSIYTSTVAADIDQGLVLGRASNRSVNFVYSGGEPIVALSNISGALAAGGVQGIRNSSTIALSSGSSRISLFSATPTITNQQGATVSGFYCNIASAASRWQLEMAGTAPSHINGSLCVNTTANTSTLTVQGSRAYAQSTVSGTVTLDGSHGTVVWSGAGTAILPLHTTCLGRMYTVAKFGTGSLSITATTWAQGQSNYTSGADFSVTLVATNLGWLRLSTSLNN